MSREQEQSSTRAPKAAPPPDIDTDAEHDRGAARKASNASLKREDATRGGARVTAAPSPVKTASKDALNARADRASFNAAQAEFEHFAHQLHVLGPQARDASRSTSADGSGYAVAVETIVQIFNDVRSGAERLGDVMAAVAPSERGLLAPALKQVKGGYVRFHPMMQLGVNFSPTHDGPKLDITELDKAIEALTPALGFDSTATLVPDTNDPMNAPNLTATIQTEIAAAEAAFESAKGGNDGDVARIVQHVEALHSHHGEHPEAVGVLKPALKKLLAHVDELKGKNPKLAAAHNLLLGMIQKPKR